VTTTAPPHSARWLLQLPLHARTRRVAETPRHAGIGAGIGADSCWGTLTPAVHRHLALHGAELLLLPHHALGHTKAITVRAPHPRVRRAALPASALPHLLAGWLATRPPAAPHQPAPLHPPVLYLLRTHAARPLREAEGARWEAFGRLLRGRGDALLVTLPPTADAPVGPT